MRADMWGIAKLEKEDDRRRFSGYCCGLESTE